MPQRSKTTIFNAALTRCGLTSITEGEGSSIWLAMDANYDEIVREAFEGGSFPFGRGQLELTSRADSDLIDYDDAFVVPGYVLHIEHLYLNNDLAEDLLERWEFRGSDSTIHLSADSRKITIQYRASGLENTWSSAFSLGVQRKLEAVIKDVEEETEESELKEARGDQMLLQAGFKASDSRNKRKMFKRGRLVRAHQRGSRSGR